MPYAVELLFDAATEAAVRRLWDVLIDAGLPTTLRDRYRPHVPLGVCREVGDVAALARDLSAFAGEQAGSPPVTLDYLGLFRGEEGVVFYGVTVTTPLLLLHRRFHAVFAKHAVDPWPHYAPGRWVPHCTLAHGLAPNQVAAAMTRLRAETVAALSGVFIGAALVEIPSGLEIVVAPFGPSGVAA